MRRRSSSLLLLLLLLMVIVNFSAAAEKRKNRPRTIPYRFLDPLEMQLSAPHSFDLQTDMFLRSMQRASVHPGAQFSRQFSPPALPKSPPSLGGVVHPPKSFTSGSALPSSASQPGAQPRSAQGGPHHAVPATKPPHLQSSVQPVTTSHKILEGPYLVDAEENTSVLPLTSSIRLLKDNEKLHPGVESSVLPIQTTHHIVEGKNKYTPPVYTPSFNKAADPHRPTHNLFKESDLAYFLTNSDVGVQQTQTSMPKSDSPLYFDSVKAPKSRKQVTPVHGFEDDGELLRSHARFESSFERQKNPRSILSPSKLQDSSLIFFEPHVPSRSPLPRSDISLPFKAVDSFSTTQSPYSSPLDRNRPHSPPKFSNNPFGSPEPQHQSYDPLVPSAESLDPSIFETTIPYGKQVSPGKLYHSLLTAQKQIHSLLDKYSPHGDLKSLENPKGFQSQGYTHMKQVKPKNQLVSKEYYNESPEENDAPGANRKSNSRQPLPQQFDHPQFRDKIKSDELDFDSKFIFNTQIEEAKPDPMNQDTHQLRAFRKAPGGRYDFKVSSGSDYSLQPHKPKRHSYESYDGFLYNYDSPSFGPQEPPRKFDQKSKEIKALKPVYAPEYKKVHRERSESLLKKLPVEKPAKDSSRIPGTPGKDYPLLREVPHTSFSCANVPHRPGIYANVEAYCQVYHVCHDDRYGEQGAAFLCSNGTLFNQVTFSCDWWYKVDCKDSTDFYDLNADARFNPYYKKTNYEAKEDTLERKSVHELSSREEKQRDSLVKYENTAQPTASQNPSRYEETDDFSVQEEFSSQYARESPGSRSTHLDSTRFSRTRPRDSHSFRRRSNNSTSSMKPLSNMGRGSARSRASLKSSSLPEE